MSPRFRDGVAPAAATKTGLLLVNLGTPSAPTAAAVRRYLAQFLHDYRVVELTRWLWCPLLHFIILPIRSGKVARKYASIWTDKGSPLMAHSRDLADALQAQLPEFDLQLAMRYGDPSIPDQLRAMQARGLQRLLVLPLYPQYSASTVAAVHDAVFSELRGWRLMPELRLVNDYHLDEGWLDAMAASVQNHWDLHGRAEMLVMSFHGVPERFSRAGDPYQQQCEAGARALAQRLQLDAGQWQLTFQSRFGREAWLQPYTEQTLKEMAARGVRSVDLVCPGFAADCLETLEENAVENAAAFCAAGGSELRYIPALNATPGHVAALAALARRHAQGWPH
ncbi:MAG: ferrochelatase [Frankiaceae bacterium]|nr:ferrochelatase [Arenimonas sp.]